ncbi:MAG: c-type cytochrome [Hyphomonas sp.]
MGELGLNKIFGALLATALGMMALMELPKIVFGGGGHYGAHTEAASLTEQMCQQFHYCIEIAEAAGTGGAVVEVFDLGAALLAADLTRGERVFASQCATCHTIAAGGANGTGPNLYNTVGADKAHIAGFNYSAALANADGVWTYENLDEWLKNPASYLRGTSMSFAGIRRDPDRAAVIAYLVSYTENAPAFPDPLPAATDEASEEGDAEAVPAEGEADAEGEDAGIEETEAPAEPAPAPVEAPAEETPEE